MASTIEKRGIFRDFEYACVANDMGHRCGYVKIPENHVLYKLDYSDKAPNVKIDDIKNEPIGKRGIMPIVCSSYKEGDSIPLDILFDVHGGLTYSGLDYPD